MRPRWAAAALLGLVVVAGGDARAAVCIDVNPVIELGCRDATQPAPPQAPSRSAEGTPATSDPEPARRNTTEPRYDPDSLSVVFRPATTAAAARAVITRAGGTVEEAIPKLDTYLIGGGDAVLRSLLSQRAVASAAHDLLVEIADTTPSDADWPQQEGLRIAGFPKAWDVTRGSSDVVVAVIDSGVDALQADLRGAVLPGYDFVNNDTDPSDDHGHGTAVAGVIAARADNHLGGAGICSRCSVLPLKVLNASGSGNDTVIAAAIVWAADHGAHVLNLSLGGPGASPALGSAIAYATAKGVVVVAAAGNAGSTSPFYPAADPRALSVAATTVTDQRYSWSNYGQWVRLAAPGCNVAPLLRGGYGSFCGTSSATPLVAGLAALALSANPHARAGDVEQALSTATRALPGVVQFGRIDAGRALALIRPGTQEATLRGTIGPGQTRTHRFDVGGGPFTATLSFGGRRPLVLTLESPFMRVSGRGPLELRAVTTAGTVHLRVSGARARTNYTLRVSSSA
jgi:subtilisin family serine protease